LNGSKVYGPKQTGLLFIRNGINLMPIIHGGGQEQNLRSGTENVPGIVGLATALVLAQKNKSKENKRLAVLQKYFIDRLLKKVKGISLNGPSVNSELRLPNNINLTIKDVEGESLMLYLDAQNIAVATGSACAAASLDPSHVLVAVGKTKQDAYSSIRLSMGHQTTKQGLDYVIEALSNLVPMLRQVNKLDK
jgi:cysteine desulfurase